MTIDYQLLHVEQKLCGHDILELIQFGVIFFFKSEAVPLHRFKVFAGMYRVTQKKPDPNKGLCSNWYKLGTKMREDLVLPLDPRIMLRHYFLRTKLPVLNLKKLNKGFRVTPDFTALYKHLCEKYEVSKHLSSFKQKRCPIFSVVPFIELMDAV